jgi:hypothetical protein
MPLLGAVDTIKLGATPVTAVIIGGTKIWPAQSAAHPGSWTQGGLNNILTLTVGLADGAEALPGTTFLVEVAEYFGTPQAYSNTLGRNDTGAPGHISVARAGGGTLVRDIGPSAGPGINAQGKITNGDAARQWGRHTLRITSAPGTGLLTTIEVLP